MDILLVEDSQTQSVKLQTILEQHGFHVTSAQNGQEGLDNLSSVMPMLIISDVMMPVMNGYEFCKQLRLNSHFKDIPVILLTTLSETEDVVYGLECGANYFITKPFDEDALLEDIQTILNVHKIRLAEHDEKDVKILIHGHEYIITAEKSHILDLLVSTYDAAVKRNYELYVARLQLQELNNNLEKTVEIRTKDLRVEMHANEKLYEELKTRASDLEKEIDMRKQIEAQLKNSLGEKEVLLREVYHRVKNNLQIISSLLSLQSDNAKEPETQQYSRDNLARIKSMALVHEMLYQSDNLVNINLLNYTTNLFKFLYSTYCIDTTRIEFKLDLDDLDINVSKTIPYGLIFSELISNIFKHAFPDNRHGKIVVALKQKNSHVILTITDDGVGMPPERNIETSKTLGMQLIHALSKQLSGNIKFDGKQGATFTLSFPID